MDEEELIPGQNWELAITKAIKESLFFIALLSSNSVGKKGYVQAELKKALEIRDLYPDEEIFIIPARIVDCTIPERLSKLHCADLFPSYESGLKKIFRVILREERPSIPTPDNQIANHFIPPSLKPKKNFIFPVEKLTEELKNYKIIDCKIPVPDKPQPSWRYIKPVLPLRSTPVTVSSKEVDKAFGLDFYHRPFEFIRNEYQDNGNGTITDKATGLMWDKHGYGPLPAGEAWSYVNKLNRQGFAGYKDWRLPTIAELVSLLEPKAQSDIHIDPIFDTEKKWFWSSDKGTDTGLFSFSFSNSFVYFGGKPSGSSIFVRSVRSEHSGMRPGMARKRANT